MQLQLACRRYAWSVVLFTRPFAFLFLSNPALKNFLSPSLPLSLPPVAVLALVYPLTALSLLLLLLLLLSRSLSPGSLCTLVFN